MISMAPSRPARRIRRHLRATLVAGLALAGLLSCAAAGAKQSDRSQMVNIDANHFDASAQPNGISHMTGDVVITQGTLKATGDRGTVYFDGQSQVKRVVLSGAAHIQQLDDHGNLMTGDAQTIDYNVPAGVAILTGNAHVKQAGRGSASGARLVYDTRSSTMHAEGSGDNRVHLTFRPRQQTAPSSARTSVKPSPASHVAQPATTGN